MPNLTIAPLAREDVKDIGRYTQKTWGVPQRDAYLGDFSAVFDKMSSGVVAGRTRNEIREGLLCYPCNKHMIFFQRDGKNNVEVLRILHERMDFEQHF